MPVVNQSEAASKVTLVPPDPYGCVFVLAEVDMAPVTTDVECVEAVATAPEQPSASRSRRRCRRARSRRARRFRSCPPCARYRSSKPFSSRKEAWTVSLRAAPGGHPGRYDSLIVIETATPTAAESLLAHAAFRELADLVCARAASIRVFPATNVKKIAGVERSKGGVFLFNFFFADDPYALMNIWDHTAGWWFVEGQMRNSELRRPHRDSEYVLINNARWDDAAPAAKAFHNPNYWNFVLANIDANRATAMPSLYRLLG